MNAEQLWTKVVKTDQCWVWQGAKTQGYGYAWFEGRAERVHRLLDLWKRGPRAASQECHHVCGNRACVRPHRQHVVRITRRQHIAVTRNNAQDRNRAKTQCPQGHPYIGSNVFYVQYPNHRSRRCRECARLRDRKVQQSI